MLYDNQHKIVRNISAFILANIVFFQFKLHQNKDTHIMWERKGHQGDDWLHGCADITGFQGKLLLEVIGTRGDGPLGDIGIDNVGMVDHCTRKHLGNT